MSRTTKKGGRPKAEGGRKTPAGVWGFTERSMDQKLHCFVSQRSVCHGTPIFVVASLTTLHNTPRCEACLSRGGRS